MPVTVTPPVGAVAGDVLTLWTAWANPASSVGTATLTGTWTVATTNPIDSGQNCAVLWYTVYNGTTTSWDLGWTGAASAGDWIMSATQNADSTTPIDGAAREQSSGTASTSHVAPAATPTTTVALLWCFTAGDNPASGITGTHTPPAGMTEPANGDQGSNDGNSFAAAAYLQLSAAGSTGTKTFTSSQSQEYVSASVAIRSQPGAGVNWSPIVHNVTTTGTASVQIVSGEGRIQRAAGAGNAGRAIGVMSPITACEMVTKVRVSNTDPGNIRFWLRASGDWAATNAPTSGYFVEWNPVGAGYTLLKRSGGVETSLGTASVVASDKTTSHWIRFRCEGSAITVRAWADGASEPGSPTISATDSTITSGVWQGNASSTASSVLTQNVFLDDLSVGELTTAPSKLSAPLMAAQLATDVTSSAPGANMSGGNWTTVAGNYEQVHYEGRGTARFLDSDGTFQGAKLVAADAGDIFDIYVRGDGGSQGFVGLKWAAHRERVAPLSVCVNNTGTGMTLATAITATSTTLQITLPTARPAAIPATHPSGVPSALWPIVASTVAPTTTTTYSRDSANYVSWLRRIDEIIGLPVYSAAAYTVSAGVLTITGCVRGMYGTTPGGSAIGAKLRTPVYIGGQNAAIPDQAFAGSPAVDVATTPIRYAAATWDYARGATSDAIRVLADLARAELSGLDVNTGQRTISGVTGATINSTSHGFATDELVMFFGHAIPTNIVSFQPYYVVSALTNSFSVAATQGGAAITPTGVPATGMDFKAAKMLAGAAPTATGNGIWLDGTSSDIYNLADGWGFDLGSGGNSNILPQDVTNGTPATPWSTRQLGKKAALQAQLSSYGYTASQYANDLRAKAATYPTRLDFIADGTYAGYGLDRSFQDQTLFLTELQMLMDVMAGRNSTGTVVSATGLKAICWLRTDSFIGTADTAATVDRYIRRGYGAWLLTYRTAATAPRLMVNGYGSSLVATPGDRLGHDVFLWDLGVPVGTDPSSLSDLTRPVAGVDFFLRTWSKGAVLVNFTSTAQSWTLTRDYYDALSEVGSDGVLSKRLSGSTLTVAAYDAAFLLH